MPDQLLRTLLLAFACCHAPCLYAQPAAIDLPDPALALRPQVIVLSGIAAEGSSGAFQTFFLSAERPFGAYQHLGLQYTAYLSQSNEDIYYGSTLQKGGFEIGLFSKFFLHGRLSGRRSHLYYGPQLRFGARQMLYKSIYVNNGLAYNYRVNTTKIMFCLGGQYTLGRAVFEWSLPLGVGYARGGLAANVDPYNNYSGNTRHFTAIPAIALGFRL